MDIFIFTWLSSWIAIMRWNLMKAKQNLIFGVCILIHFLVQYCWSRSNKIAIDLESWPDIKLQKVFFFFLMECKSWCWCYHCKWNVKSELHIIYGKNHSCFFFSYFYFVLMSSLKIYNFNEIFLHVIESPLKCEGFSSISEYILHTFMKIYKI